MFRKSVLLAAMALTLAAGAAFANNRVTGTVTKVNPALGEIWLNNGMEFHVRKALAAGLLPGDAVTVLYSVQGNDIHVLSASPAGL